MVKVPPYLRDMPDSKKALLRALLGSSDGSTMFDDALDPSLEPLFPEDQRHRHPGGRPMKYSTALAQEICAYIVCFNASLSEALDYHGISRTTGWRWRSRYPYFSQWADRALNAVAGYPSQSPRAVMKRRLRRLGGTLRASIRGKPMDRSRFRPEMASAAVGSVRKTAAALGVSPSTVQRWIYKYPKDFGYSVLSARVQDQARLIKRRLDKIEARP